MRLKFYENCDHFKNLLIKCPHHGFENWRIVQYFYNNLAQANRSLIESMKNDSFLQLNDDYTYTFIESLAKNSQQWDFLRYRDRSSALAPKKQGFEVHDDVDVKARLEVLTR